jgi:erythromycin esterase-like protein
MFSAIPSSRSDPATVDLLKLHVTPFSSIDPELNDFPEIVRQRLDDFGNAKVLLIGDASHGTHEFYAARAEITKYMIQYHGYSIVAVEADWPDAEAVDRFVRWRAALPDPVDDTDKIGRAPAFTRFPTWMWRNHEVRDFVEWLRGYNKGTETSDAVGFYGLDLYSLGSSMQAVIEYLERVDPQLAETARKRYAKLMGWSDEPQEYGFEVALRGMKGYEKECVDMLRDLLKKRLEFLSRHEDGVEFHSAEQNARLVVGEYPDGAPLPFGHQIVN